jgi:hypothetical protein
MPAGRRRILPLFGCIIESVAYRGYDRYPLGGQEVYMSLPAQGKRGKYRNKGDQGC